MELMTIAILCMLAAALELRAIRPGTAPSSEGGEGSTSRRVQRPLRASLANDRGSVARARSLEREIRTHERRVDSLSGCVRAAKNAGDREQAGRAERLLCTERERHAEKMLRFLAG